MFGLGFWAASGANGGGGVAAYELISTTVLGSSQSSVTFSGLGTSAAAYKHLQIRYVSRADGAYGLANQKMRYNSDSGANYGFHELFGGGSSVSSGAALSRTESEASMDVGSSISANAFIAGIVDILDFSNTSKYKTTRALSGIASSAGGQGIKLGSSLWQSTAAITSVTMLPVSGNFVTGSRFSIYGLKA